MLTEMLTERMNEQLCERQDARRLHPHSLSLDALTPLAAGEAGSREISKA